MTLRRKEQLNIEQAKEILYNIYSLIDAAFNDIPVRSLALVQYHYGQVLRAYDLYNYPLPHPSRTNATADWQRIQGLEFLRALFEKIEPNTAKLTEIIEEIQFLITAEHIVGESDANL